MGAAQSSSRSTTRDAVTRVTAAVKTATPTKQDILAQNLKTIGQVNVQSTASIQRSLEMTHVIRTRALSESDDPSVFNGNSIDAFGLSELLDARRDSKKAQTTQMLTQRYKLDTNLIERLAKRYNTPSVAREYNVNLSDGDMRTYREAAWISSP